MVIRTPTPTPTPRPRATSTPTPSQYPDVVSIAQAMARGDISQDVGEKLLTASLGTPASGRPPPTPTPTPGVSPQPLPRPPVLEMVGKSATGQPIYNRINPDTGEVIESGIESYWFSDDGPTADMVATMFATEGLGDASVTPTPGAEGVAYPAPTPTPTPTPGAAPLYSVELRGGKAFVKNILTGKEAETSDDVAAAHRAEAAAYNLDPEQIPTLTSDQAQFTIRTQSYPGREPTTKKDGTQGTPRDASKSLPTGAPLYPFYGTANPVQAVRDAQKQGLGLNTMGLMSPIGQKLSSMAVGASPLFQSLAGLLPEMFGTEPGQDPNVAFQDWLLRAMTGETPFSPPGAISGLQQLLGEQPLPVGTGVPYTPEVIARQQALTEFKEMLSGTEGATQVIPNLLAASRVGRSPPEMIAAGLKMNRLLGEQAAADPQAGLSAAGILDFILSGGP